MDRVRIDKWLWAARFYKTRTAATDAVTGGHVHVNGVRAKPSKDIQIGDDVQVTVSGLEWTVTVTGLADRRGSAAVAATLYTESDASRVARAKDLGERRASRPLGADLGERPTKRDRRRIEQLRGTRR